METQYRRESCFLFFAVALIYSLLGSGWPDTVDATPSFLTAKAIVEHGELGFQADGNTTSEFLVRKGIDGKLYSKLGLIMPLLYVPAVIVEKTLNLFLHYHPDVLGLFLISFCNGLITAALIALIFLFFRRREASFEWAAIIALTMGFATYLFPYARGTSREPMQALCFFGCFSSLLTRPKKSSDLVKSLIAAGAWVSFGVLTKQIFFLPVLPALLLVRWKDLVAKSNRKGFLIALIIPSVSVLTMALYGLHAYGQLFATGYSTMVTHVQSGPWGFPIGEGIRLQLISLKTGFFTYSPLLLLAFPLILWKIYAKTFRTLDFSILLAITLQVLIYAFWWKPLGDSALGPRYLVAIAPLFVLFLLNTPFEKGERLFLGRHHLQLLGKTLMISIAIFSLAVQMINISVKSQQFYTLSLFAKRQPEISQTRTNLILLKHKLLKHDENYQLAEFGLPSSRAFDMSELRSMVGLDFWWAHLWYFHHHGVNPGKELVSPKY